MIFSAIKTQQVSTDRKFRLHLEIQFHIKLLRQKIGGKTFTYFKKSQNHLKNLFDFFSSESRRRSGAFIANFEQISHIVLVFP